jgi:ABC-type bacteriocin/lantibiotic exporter with double-glycine peptidase domain
MLSLSKKMCLHKMPVCLLFVLFSVAPLMTAALAQEGKAVNCGVQSALSLAVVQNRTVSAELQQQLIKAYPETAISLAEVKRIAKSLGIEMTGVKVTLDELTAMQQPAIVHLTQPDHFVLMVDGTAENIRLLEQPQAKVSVVPRAGIERRFDGYALILTPAPDDRPRVQFDRTDVVFENIGTAEKIEREFKFTNIGQKELIVSVAGST